MEESIRVLGRMENSTGGASSKTEKEKSKWANGTRASESGGTMKTETV